MPRERIDLCNLWRFQPDPGLEGEKTGYYNKEYDTRFWREVKLPCDFETCLSNLDSYEGTGWFRKNINIPDGWNDKRIVLRFEGVNYHAKVWVNGEVVGENHDGFLPFEFPIENFIKFGEDNVIVVRADNIRRAGEVPGLQRGWRAFGGILREVELIATNLLYIDQVKIVAEPTETGGKFGIFTIIKNQHPKPVELEMLINLTDKDGNSITKYKVEKFQIESGEKIISKEYEIEGVKKWSPLEPNLYIAEINLSVDDDIIDEKKVRFGFRKIDVHDGKLLLNGNPIYLTGFNRHEDSPRRNMTADLETARADLIDMKNAGSNFVRLCHYPHHPAELDLCDELGMLAMDEIPLYWWDGLNEGEENYKLKFQAAKRQLKTMINRDINHPSVIFWSVSNENHEDRPEVAKGNQELVRLAKGLDPTHLAVHVSSYWERYPNFDSDDVICVNNYPSLNKRGFEGKHDYDFSESTKYWRDNLQKLHKIYPQKPILVTEFGYASFEGVYGNGFGEDTQAQAIEKEFAGMDAPYVCGATIWCWADHPWPPSIFSFSYYLGISPYGVVTRERRKLMAYRTVRRIFREKQGFVEPPRKESSPGTGVTMIRPNLLDIPQIPFPEGFSIRPMRTDEGAIWRDIERDAERYFSVSDEIFYHQFGSDLPATQWRSYLIFNEKGVAVGTISAWYVRDFRNEDYGLVHWVAVRPAYHNKGIGKAALSYALNQMAQWHDKAYLNTSIERIPAIKLYLDFGFLPDLDSPHALEKWRKLKENLKHPVLEKLIK